MPAVENNHPRWCAKPRMNATPAVEVSKNKPCGKSSAARSADPILSAVSNTYGTWARRPLGSAPEMKSVLVDSVALIEVSRGRNAAIVDRWLELSDSAGTVLSSCVSVAEPWAGAPLK
jgi:hypothetical protein